MAGEAQLTNKFTPPPYTYIHILDMSDGTDWQCPSDIVICEVRCKSLGTVKITTRQNKTAKRFFDNYDIDRIDVRTIHADSTSESLLKNQISVSGHYIKDLSGL